MSATLGTSSLGNFLLSNLIIKLSLGLVLIGLLVFTEQPSSDDDWHAVSSWADVSLVLCDCLRFIVSKYGKTSAKTLKMFCWIYRRPMVTEGKRYLSSSIVSDNDSVTSQAQH